MPYEMQETPDMQIPDDPAGDRMIAEHTAFRTRLADQEVRRGARGAVAIVDVEELMRELVRYGPRNRGPEAAGGYLAAVKDIALAINAATLEHDPETGALSRVSAGLAVSPDDVIDPVRAEWPGLDGPPAA